MGVRRAGDPAQEIVDRALQGLGLLEMHRVAGARDFADLALRQAHCERMREPDVVYDPTPAEVVEAMLALAALQPGDVLYDLGSGDGIIVITAAYRLKSSGYGVDIDEELVRLSNQRAKSLGISERVLFEVPMEARVREAAKVLGIDFNLIASQPGFA